MLLTVAGRHIGVQSKITPKKRGNPPQKTRKAAAPWKREQKKTTMGKERRKGRGVARGRWHQAPPVTHQAVVLNGLNKQLEKGIMKMPPPGRHHSSLTFPGCRV